MSSRKSQSLRKRPLRLPAIAPKDDVTPLNRHGGSPTTVRATIIQPRLRFPPRSRTGFKCDEVHPQCNQCARLGHICDYQPRLCFRDDTRRVMERMPDVKTKGNTVWDPKMTFQSEHFLTPDSISSDVLPDFSTLTSDEDRERKAQGSVPGTYHVIVVPESFSRLPEYTEDAFEAVPSNPYSSPLSEYSSYDPMDEVTTSEDPNVVILNRFKDSRKQAYSSRPSYTQSPESDLGSNSISTAMMYTSLQDISEGQVSESVDFDTFDLPLLDHFQNVVWMQLIPGGHGYLDAHVFEQEVSNFPPLLHVMSAMAALSLVRQGTSAYMDILLHYDQEAMPSIQSSLENFHDVLTDGLFLTHFLLLIYQITFAKPCNGSNIWSHHMSRLLQLSLLRQSEGRGERYTLIIWLICRIDLYALFSGAGTGEYVRAAMENHLYTDAEVLSHTVGLEGPSVTYAEENNNLLLIMRLYREVMLLAAKLGLSAASFRGAKGLAHMTPFYREVEELRESFGHLWESHEVQFFVENYANLPQQSQHSFQQAIYQFAKGTPSRHSGPLFINFPLFLAGAVTSSNRVKMMALEMLSNLGGAELGYETSTISSLLQIVCEAQFQHSRDGGHVREIDWMDLLVTHGRRRLVSFG
ncbi:hypothetical protein BJX70DRAFT_391932 [Aspergillus crustosus]